MEIISTVQRFHEKTQTGTKKVTVKVEGKNYKYVENYGPGYRFCFVHELNDNYTQSDKELIYSTTQPENNTELGAKIYNNLQNEQA